MVDFSRLGFGGPLSAEVERELNVDRLIHLTQQLRVTASGHLVNGTIVVILLWPLYGANTLIWGSMIWAFGLISLYRWARNRKKPRPDRAPDRLERSSIVQSLIAGLIWGVGCAIFMPTDNLIVLVLIVAIVTGNMTGGAFALYPMPSAALAFILSIMMPPWFVVLTLDSSLSYVITTMAVFYLMFLVFSIRITYLNLVQQVEMRVELQALRREAVHANRSKNTFLSSVSHELRTPLNAIIGFAEVVESKLKLKGDFPELLEYTGYISSSGRGLLGLINDVLNITRFEAGEVHLAEAKVDLNKLLHRTMAQFAIEEKPDLKISLPDADSEVLIIADESKLRQILTNIIGNAVKYTPTDGSIDITVTVDLEQGLELKVQDTGIGIGPEALKDVFQPFNRAHRAIRDNASGTGLGLALSKNFAELHGGDLTLESEQGKGTSLTLDLPPSRIVQG